MSKKLKKRKVEKQPELDEIQEMFTQEMKSIKQSANEIIPQLLKKDKETMDRLAEILRELKENLNNLREDDEENKQLHISEFISEMNSLSMKNTSQVIIKSLYLNVFSEFDAFLNNMLRCIFNKKKSLVSNSEKNYTVQEILAFDDIKTFRNDVIEKEIDSLLRKSYIEQFSAYEKKFSISTLKKFDNWPTFVEISQRRNILMHCDGRVTAQYFNHCTEHNCLEEDIEIDDKITVSFDYLMKAIDTVIEVGVKLIHVIWRKQFPEDLKSADSCLRDYVFDLLCDEDFNLAEIIGIFSCSQTKYYEKIDEYINVINYSIALKHLGKTDELKNQLNKYDWSSVVNELRLARYILINEYDKIAEFIEMIGDKSNLFVKEAYLTFPIFTFVSNEDYFKNAFENVFNENYDVLKTSMEFKLKVNA